MVIDQGAIPLIIYQVISNRLEGKKKDYCTPSMTACLKLIGSAWKVFVVTLNVVMEIKKVLKLFQYLLVTIQKEGGLNNPAKCSPHHARPCRILTIDGPAFRTTLATLGMLNIGILTFYLLFLLLPKSL